MPQPHQYVRPDIWARVRICLEFQHALKRPVAIRDILNEILQMGLEAYSQKHGVCLPPFDAEAEAYEPWVMPRRGRPRKERIP